jgi:glycosyltransferase involved in cell wall biosynthesis
VSERTVQITALSAQSEVTVVIPVWGARYVDSLGRAIASVRAQDEDVPIIVADNASEVEVPEIEGTVVVRSATRLSVGEARNLGLDPVESEYVVVLDADDELAPGALADLRAGIDANPDAAVYSMSLIEADTGARHRTPRRFVTGLARKPRLFAVATAIWSLYPIQGSAILRTAWVRDAGAYPDCNWGDDWVLAVSQAFRGRVAIDPRPAIIYHAHSESLWRRGRPAGDLLAAARQVRHRLSTDPAVPSWVRAALPLIAALQTALILVVRPPYRATRKHLWARRTSRV